MALNIDNNSYLRNLATRCTVFRNRMKLRRAHTSDKGREILNMVIRDSGLSLWSGSDQSQ